MARRNKTRKSNADVPLATRAPVAYRTLGAVTPRVVPDFVRRIVWAWLIAIWAGFIIARLPGVTAGGAELSPDRAVFTAVNAGTLTGFRVDVGGPEVWSWPLWAVAILLSVAGALFSTIVGGTAVVRLTGLGISDRRVVRFCIGILLVSTVIGSLFLLRSDVGFGEALLRALGAYANSGYLASGIRETDAFAVFGILMPLSLLGGLGIPVVIDLFDAVRGRATISRYSQTVLLLTASVFIVGTLLVWILNTGDSASHALPAAALAALDCRSAGFPFAFESGVGRATQWVLMAVMLLGAAPGGTGGGLKVTTPLALFKGILSTLRGEPSGRPFGVALSFVVTTFAIGIFGYLLLLQLTPQMDPERLLLLAVSALCNVGVSHDRVSLVGPSLYVLDALMLIGRVLPAAALWWAAIGGETDVLPAG